MGERDGFTGRTVDRKIVFKALSSDATATVSELTKQIYRGVE
jgi:hypothetical protein